MVGFPIGLGWFLMRRLKEPFPVWAMGALAFVASQIVHLPLNYALGLLGPPRGVALMPLPVVGLVAGLSAGICEEVARWLAFRHVLRRSRSWNSAVVFGAGHGGIEAIAFGFLVALGLANVLLAPAAASMGLSEDQQAALRHAARLYWQTPWYHPVLAGWERLCAIAFHIGASTLVLRAIVRRNVGYLLAAIGLHAALNFPIVYSQQLGLAALYAYLTLAALGMLALTRQLRRSW